MDFLNLIWQPNKAVETAAKTKNIGESILVLVIGGLLLAIAFALLFSNMLGIFGSVGITGSLIAAFIIFAVVVIFGLVKGFFLYKLMEALGTKSDYYAGVSVFAYTLVPIFIWISIGGSSYDGSRFWSSISIFIWNSIHFNGCGYNVLCD